MLIPILVAINDVPFYLGSIITHLALVPLESETYGRAPKYLSYVSPDRTTGMSSSRCLFRTRQCSGCVVSVQLKPAKYL